MSEALPKHAADTKGSFLSNRSYDAAKFITQIFLPGLGTLYFALAAVWGLPNAEQVIGTITALDAFLGLLLGVSSKSYNNSDAKYDGSLDVIKPDENTVRFSLNLDGDPMELENKKEITFKVNPQ